MAEKDDNQYKRLPVVLQTTAVKNFFEYTVDQLYSEANVETLNGFVGTPDWDGIRAEGAYLEEPTATKQAYSLSPTINTINPETGEPESLVYYDEVVDILKTYGVDVRNQNKLFDAPYFTFSPPINEDKLVNYSEYYWAPPGANVTPNAIIISGTVDAPVDVEDDILGKQYYVHYGANANVTFRNGMVVEFKGDYVNPYDVYVGNEYVVEGVGYEIDLIPIDRNSTAPYDANAEPSYVVIERGAVNNNGWSRNNYWYHKNNWYDAGEVPPDRIYRAQRPIIEFDHRLETYNTGTNFLQSVDLAVTTYNYDQVNGLPANVDIDGVDPADKTMIFPAEGPDRAPYVYLGVPYDTETIAIAYNNPVPSANAVLKVEIAGNPGAGFVDKVLVEDQGSGYDPDGLEILIFTQDDVDREAKVQGTVYKGIAVGDSTIAAPFSLLINNAGMGYESNTIAISFETDNPTGSEIEPVAVPYLDQDGSIVRIDVVTRGDNYDFNANISVVVSGPNTDPASIDVILYDSYLASVEVIDPGLGYTQYQSIVLEPVANVSVGDSVLINEGTTQRGNEYYYTEQGWVLADTKRSPNDAPLFVIYDDTGTRMDDDAKYPQSDFAGNKIFSYATPEDIRDEDAASVTTTLDKDPVLGFPLVYRPFKAASEIVFTNNLEHDKYTYVPLGSEESENIMGYNFYHLLPEGADAAEEYFPYWKPSDRSFNQAIISRYQLSQIEIDRNIREFFIGCVPNPASYNFSGVEVYMYLNGKPVKGFTLIEDVEGYIKVNDNVIFSAGDYVEIIAYSNTGLLSLQSASKYELPIGWDRNIFKENIRFTSEPEYLEHFKTQIESQIGFVGEPLGQNNYQSTAQDTSYATEIVQSDSDVILAGYLLDDQPHNLIDALRFNAGEYTKYKDRLKKTINDYYATKQVDENNIDRTLELILREVIAFRVGKNVFNRTYVVPFGDNFIMEQSTIGGSADTIVLDSYLDLSLIEHSLLVFATGQGSLLTDMLLVDRDYVIESTNPITIRLIGDYLGSTITTKLYTSERDSAQCPPTPSVLGIYPLYQPEIITDDTFETPQEVLIGHDGSRTPTYGDARDQLLLDFEQRIYNAAKKEFREANSLPELNFFDIRPGEFRNTGFSYVEWYNLMRYHFSTWAGVNQTDPVTNEFYDSQNPWTWNYRGYSDVYPGHWRGLYEYYYDTVRPHTHPWEMLGFTEKPLWWDSQYGTDYGSGNTAMWDDLESGIIRQGHRENLSNELWKLPSNPYAREYLFKYLPVDANGNLKSPDQLPSGITTEDVDYNSVFYNTDLYPIVSESFIVPYIKVPTTIYPGVTVSASNGNVYVESSGVLNYDPPPGRFEPQPFSVNLPDELTVGPSDMPQGNSIPTGGLIGIAVNGIALINPQSGRSFNDDGEWHYNEVFDGGYDYDNPGKYDDRGGYQYYIIPPKMIGQEEFTKEVHSPIIGWALDGLPIYGPYGYTEYSPSGLPVNFEITNIKSPYVLRTTRVSNPGGLPSGLFVEDYKIDSTLVGTAGYAGTNATTNPGENFAIRYGVTPDSPDEPIWFYVQCEDDDGKPMFPYACGGGIKEHPTGSLNTNIYANQFFGTPNDLGGIFEITVTDCGYDYVATAVVSIEGDGQNAKSYPIMSDGVIRNVVVDNPGINYAWDTTTIEILGDGTGAQAEPIVIDGKITGVKMLNFGSGYTYATPVIKQAVSNDGTSPGQFAELRIPTAIEDNANGIVDNAVTAIVVTNSGYGYTYADIVIEPAVSPTPPVTYEMGYEAKAVATLETAYNNSTGNGYVDPDATPILESEIIEIFKVDNQLKSSSWRYSDGAPVENAWKYSENYPFAVAEGLLLGQPAQFATQFADPTKLFRAEVDSRQQLCTVTRERWQFTDPAQFRIHGERDSEGNFLTNIGYTQFINSWLAFQGLDTNIEFAPQLRTINMRLSHRMSGYVDKDTMTVRTDQYSATGTTPSLIIPQDNINIQIHSSPYKSRNFYTGVIIEKAVGGYKVRGYDRSVGTFPVLKIDRYSPSRGIEVGGEPAPYSVWERNKFYKKDAIVSYAGSYYKAPKNLTTADEFNSRLWNRIPSLPQINGASAEIWSKYLNQVDFVPYETLLKTPQEVVDLLMSLGAWQKNAGYDFQGLDYNTGDSINWEHASKQFLFWTTGKWEIGNTIELSPMAGGVTFKAPRGFIAKLNRIDRNQFSILDVDGSAITPESCEIVRLQDYIQITPPQGSQIYGVLLFVKEIEHAMTLENRTDFNDIIYDPVLHQYQTRVKVKGKRTANWTGKFTSEGFIILDDELKPNLDNLAQSMGRYHELGFIPVEKQVYESARALFGYQSRSYLRDLDILDDQQFDFYKGMLQSKGTQTSMTRIGESNSIIIDGQITVYDEWAVKVGDFGDVESQQAIEFKLDRSNVTSDPQLVTLVFPEDVTGIVDRVDVINRNNSYSSTPAIVISPPLLSNGTPVPGGRQATAKAHLRPSDNKLDYIEMTDKGRGYEFATASIITQGDNSSDAGTDVEFTQAIAIGGLSDEAWAEQPINGNCWIKTKNDTIQFSQMTLSDDGFIITPSNVALFTSSTNTNFKVGDTITISDQSGTLCKSDGITCANMANLNGTFNITEVDETTTGTTISFTADYKVGYPSTYGVSILYDLNTMVLLEFDNVYYHEANIEVTPFEYGGKEIEDIINAETANTGVTASMYASHVPNERQPGQSGGDVIDWYTLVLRSDTEFELIEESPSNVWSDQFHISTGTYTNQQRWAIDVASGTEAEDITVIVNGQIIDQCKFYEISSDGVPTGNCEVYNWIYMPGGIYEGTANVSNPDQPTLVFGEATSNAGILLNTLQPYTTDPYAILPAYDDQTSTILVDGEYPFLDLMIGNVVISPTKKVFETVGNVNMPVTKTVWEATDGFTQITVYPDMLPESILDDNGNIIADLPTKLIEKASIKFTEDFNGDIYGSNISIDVSADDDLLCKIGRERTYEITQDIANDDIIVIDVDDPNRFLKKPTGEMTTQLWPEYTDVNYLGVKDSKDYPNIPNAGYVNSANVNFQAYDIGSLPLLFDPSVKIQPTGGHTIHVANSENSDWNVYELKPTGADIQFLARQDDRVSLFTNFSLFNYIDGNMIGEDDTGRFLDYYLTLRNADVSDNVVVWTNETIIQQAQSTISDLTAPRMIEARLRSLSPSEDSIRRFTNYLPIGDSYYNNINMSPSGLDQGQQAKTESRIGAYLLSEEVIFFSEDPNNEDLIILPLNSGPNENSGGGTGANFTLSWDVVQIGVNNYEATPNANSIVWTSYGTGYEIGDEIQFTTANSVVGIGTLTVTEVQRTQTGFVRSNVITVGGIATTSIQEGDVVRLIEGGTYSRATVSIDNILIDYANYNIAFANVSNADEFIVDNTLYVDTSPVSGSVVGGIPFTILNNLGNTVIVTSPIIQDPTVMDSITTGSFGGTNEISTLNQYDLGESAPNNEDTYYNVFNVTNKTGVTTFQVERPNTYINYADVSSDVIDITVVNGITVRANVAANVFTAFSQAIGIDDFSGTLSPLNGLWPIINVAPNPNDANVEIISFNTIRTLPQGTYVPPGNVYVSDTAMKVNVQHLNKTRLVMPNVTDIKVGDQIKVIGNSFSGVYNADKVVTEYNVGLGDNYTTYVDINAPYLFDGDRSGNVLLGGLKFTTTNPHGITPEYAAQNKRIAVHFAYPKAYNRIYNISRVDPYNIYVDEVMTQSAETINYYTYDTVSLSKDDNIYVTTDEVILTRVTATYAGNAEVIDTNLYTVNRGKIIFSPELFPGTGNYVTLNIIREIDRSFDRYPVVTTVDHNKIRLNGVNFTINSYNNPEAIVENINRAASLMRGWVTPAGNGMTFSFPMMKDYRKPVFAPDGSLRPAYTINNYGPYIRDKNTLAMLKNDPEIDTGILSLSTENEKNNNPEFNLGSIKIGPTKGATYYDQDEKVYKIWLQEGPTDTEGGYYPLGVYYNDQNRTVLPKRPKTFKKTPSSHVDGGPIVNIIPGNYPTRRADATQPGQTQYEYDMGAISEYSFPPQWIDSTGAEVVPQALADIQDNPRPSGTVKIYRYRLKSSTLGYYEVYENVELTNGEVVAIKVDSVIPSSNPQDYFKTQTAYNNFYSISSNSINFDSKVAFNASKVDLYPSYSGGSINLGPVQPPADIGKVTIPEPYAIRRSGRTRGNGSDSLLNFAGMPDTKILVDENNDYRIVINKPGFNNFSMWQPGLIPGEQNPPTTPQTAPKPFGKGSGYYEPGDGNSPEMFQVISTKEDMTDQYDYGNITMGWADPRHCPANNPYIDCTIDDSVPVRNDYPVVESTLGWVTPQPRFKYSKRFSIDTSTSNNDETNDFNGWANSSVYFNSQESRYAFKKENDQGNTTVYINGQYPDTNNTSFRPDEIFVACFWTERHLYKDQVVGYGPDTQNSGTRTEIIKDYYGTITRCKYIRLTELPLDAVLQRPECDTGWAGSLESATQDSTGSGASDESTGLDLLDNPPDATAGTSATQNDDINTGAEYTGGVSAENPDNPEAGPFDIDNRNSLPGGYESQDNIIVEPRSQIFATPPNPEASQAPGIGLNDLSSIEFGRSTASGETPFNNTGVSINDTGLQQDTSITYPTVPNTDGGASPVFNPSMVILPGPCDITSTPEGNTVVVSADCDEAPSSVLTFTGSNNYYGITRTGPEWAEDSVNYDLPKYEWHNFGKLVNAYGGGTYGYVEIVVDFRDERLTAGGITLVQAPTPFGTLLSGQTFNPRDPNQQGFVNSWWSTASVVPLCNSSGTTPEREADMLYYGVEDFNLTSVPTPDDRAKGDTIPLMESRIGVTGSQASSFNNSDRAKKPSNWGFGGADAWYTSDIIIGGSNSGVANLNSIKGVFGFRNKIECGFGQYLTVFIHIGHESGKTGSETDFIVPRYDFAIRYNHNVFGYGGTDETFEDVCGTGEAPASMDYASGAKAKAYKSGNEASQDQEYKYGAAIRAGVKQYVNFGTQYPGTKDDTDILEEGKWSSWLFDNVYFPYNAPARQGEPEQDNTSGPLYELCCDPGDQAGTYIVCGEYLATVGCGGDDDDGNPGFGGGCVVLESYLPGSQGRSENISQAYKLRIGTYLELGTEDLDVIQGEVKDIATDIQPCVRVTTKLGASLVCSTTAPIYTQDGEYLDAPELLGKYVAVMIDGATSFDEVVSVDPVGDKFVAVIDTGDNNFWAGEQPGKYLMHHNMSILGGANEDLDKDKK